MLPILQRCYAILRNAISGAISKSRAAEARAIEKALHNRVAQLLVGYHPIIRIELHRWHWQTLHSVMWTGPFSALVYLDGNCYCGMSFDLIGDDLRINQLHGVRGLNLCPYIPMRRNWGRTLVEAAHDLGFRILLVRAEHTNSWRTASPELRKRLGKRMDGTARTLGLRPMGAHWVWESDAGALHLPQPNTTPESRRFS